MTDSKVLRKQKIDFFVKGYKHILTNNDVEYVKVFNAIIMDSVGISGLKEVKSRAWK